MMDKEQLKNAINKSKAEAGQADVALRYFDGQHDILDHKITVITDQGVEIESPYSSNIKLPNPFFTKLVTQSTDFIFGEPLQFNTDDELLSEALKLYITSETHQLLYEAVKEASKKGKEWIYAYKDEQGLINFMRIDSRQMAEVVDEYGRQQAVIRYREDEATVWHIDGTIKEYIKGDEDDYELKKEGHHTVYDKKTGEVVSGIGKIPFFKLQNNKDETSDLHLLKAKIDDYDRMDSYATNDLQDFRSNIVMFKGLGKGQGISQSARNLFNTGAIGMGGNLDVDVKSNNVSIEQRLNKMERIKQDIYEIGQGFDASTISNSNGNVTNEALMAGQKNLQNKTKGKKVYLNVLIEWMLELILEDIGSKGLGEYSVDAINVVYTHDLIESDKDKSDIEKTEMETKKIKADILLSFEHILDEETMLREVSKLLDIDYEEVRAQVRMDGYGDSLIDIVDAEVID